MLTERTPIVIKIPVKINNVPTGEFATIDGYLFNPSEREKLYAYFLEEVEKDNRSYVYEMWKACDAAGGRVYLANTDPDFNPQTTFLRDKGHTQLLGYFLTGTSLEEKGYIASDGGWIEVASSHPIHPVADNEDDSNTKIADIPNHMFLMAWLAAGNVFMPDLPNNFERWLEAIGVPLNKRIAIMNMVSLRGVDIKLFDAAADRHMQQIKDPAERRKVRRTLQHRRDWIKELKERK